MILCNSDRNRDKLCFYAQLLVEKQVDGIILVGVLPDEQLESIFRDEGVPSVVVERDASHAGLDCVLADNGMGGRLAAEHLLRLGHRRIGCITGSGEIPTFSQRREGFREALANAHAPLDAGLSVEGSVRLHGGARATRQLLSLDEPPTAIFANNDLMALGAIHAAGEMGVGVPGGLSVVGFDDVRIASLANPSLTTIAQPKSEMAVGATEMLLERIQNPGLPPRRLVLPTHLVERASTRAIAGDVLGISPPQPRGA